MRSLLVRTVLLLPVVLALGLPVANAQAPATGGVLDFARKYKGMFPSEIGDRALIEAPLRSRRHVMAVTISFDDARQTLHFKSYENVIAESCRRTGQGNAVTVMGVRFSYTTSICHRVVLKGDPIGVLEFTMPATPALFRQIKQRGIDVEYTVQVTPGDGALVDYERHVGRPALDYRHVVDAHRYAISAEVVERRYFIAGERTPLSVLEIPSNLNAAALSGQGLTSERTAVAAPSDSAASASPAAERAQYGELLRARIEGNVVQPPNVPATAEAEFRVTQLPTGEVLSASLVRSSGFPMFDQAIERAIIKSSPLPRPARPELFTREFRLTFSPRN